MRLSVITPTLGRASLRGALDSLVAQLDPEDEAIVVGDGPQPAAHAITRAYDGRVRYEETPATRAWGYHQRNFGVEMAKGDFLWFIDDDDIAAPDAIQAIKLKSEKDRPNFFRMRFRESGKYVWKTPELKLGNVGTPNFVFPNDPAKLGEWHSRHSTGRGGDYFFAEDTVKAWNGLCSFKDHVIATIPKRSYGK